ncbi:hypothetical protein AFV9_gp49 [Betalipothrixvirus uzonense]|uniref:Uncharacterized protein n=1 Tax=Betalipothrixvirus uzonense TaxID=512792 RepID=B2CRM6_9VIRU|nr:hypothetical protein AFV9_gp49 [Acidianus filamentous virus 9]ACB37283.1 hypothetical protein [Acidianus filamentous virus 9]
MPCGKIEQISDGITKTEHYEMVAYQKSGENVLIKGKLFLSTVLKLREIVKDNFKVEFFIGEDLNKQRLFIIRETTNSLLRKNKETVKIENCDLYITRVSPNVVTTLIQLLSDNREK